MPNPDFSDIKSGRKGRHGNPPDVAAQRGSKSSMNVKPAFPSATNVGKEGPNRSAGVKRAKQHPKDIGL
jgi:hypothetical protein